MVVGQVVGAERGSPVGLAIETDVDAVVELAARAVVKELVALVVGPAIGAQFDLLGGLTARTADGRPVGLVVGADVGDFVGLAFEAASSGLVGLVVGLAEGAYVGGPPGRQSKPTSTPSSGWQPELLSKSSFGW